VTEAVNENYDSLGYESLYFINNMGTLAIYFSFFPIFLIVDAIVKSLKRVCKSFEPVSDFFDHNMYWNSWIRLVLESYANIMMCCLIQF